MKRPLLFLFCLVCLVIFLYNPAAYRPDPVFPLGEKYQVEVTGRVSARSAQDDRLSLTLEDCRLLHEGKNYYCSRLSLTLFCDSPSSLPSVQAGNCIHALGRLSGTELARNPGNFNWYGYNQSRRISYQVTADYLTVTDDSADFFREGLLRLQAFLGRRLELICGEDGAAASILRALILGDRSDLDERIQTLYEEGGILHILSVSGFHVSLLGSICLILARRFGLPPKLQKILAAILALIYWQLCGQSLSAGRAAVMFVCLSASFLFERSYDSLSALSLSGILFLIDSPAMLFQAGFQLSYGAVLAIRLVCPAFAAQASRLSDCLSPAFEKLEDVLPRSYFLLFRRLASRFSRSILHSFFFGLGLQLALLPVTLYHFFRYPVYSIFLNLVVLPLAAPLFICAAAALLASFVSLPLGSLLLIPSRIILWIFEKLFSLAVSLPLASYLGGRPSPARIAAYYILLSFLCLLLRGQSLSAALSRLRSRFPSFRLPLSSWGLFFRRHNALLLCLRSLRLNPLHFKPLRFKPLLLCLLALAALLLPLPRTGLIVTFLDVGQGDCAFLRASDGTAILIDGGSSDISSAAAQRLIPFLESQRISRLDYVFISHTDEDHTNAVTGFLEAGYDIGTLILPDLPDHLAGEDSYRQFLSLAEKYQIPLYLFSAGASLTLRDLSLLCLAPSPPQTSQAAAYTSLNSASQVLLLEYQGIRILFTGDCGEEGEALVAEELKTRGISSCQILKVGHHGSSTSTGAALLDQIQPAAAVISCGAGNRYGHPHPDTLERLYDRNISVFVTAACGAVTLRIQNGRVRLTAMIP